MEVKEIQDVNEALKTFRDVVEGKYAKTESEVKEIGEKVAPVVLAFEELKSKLEADAVHAKSMQDSIENLEKLAAKSKGEAKMDIKSITSHVVNAMAQATTTDQTIAEIKTRAATDSQAGGALIETSIIDSLLLTYMRDESPMLREATVLTRPTSNGFDFIVKTLIDGAKSVGEKQAGRGRTERKVEKRTLTLSRYYSQDATTEEFLTAQNYEGESVILRDIMGDLGLNIQDDMLRGDGNNSSPFGLLNAPFLTSTAFETEGVGGKLTWTDLFNVQDQFNFERYRNRGKFFLNFSILLHFLTEKDGNGLPVYQPGINGSMQSTLAGHPYVIMPGMDRVATANTLPLLFGDMASAYVGAITGNYKTYRDEITQKDLGITEFGIATFAGGRPRDEEAIRAVKGK